MNQNQIEFLGLKQEGKIENLMVKEVIKKLETSEIKEKVIEDWKMLVQ